MESRIDRINPDQLQASPATCLVVTLSRFHTLMLAMASTRAAIASPRSRTVIHTTVSCRRLGHDREGY
jgi:hypothetical protein